MKKVIVCILLVCIFLSVKGLLALNNSESIKDGGESMENQLVGSIDEVKVEQEWKEIWLNAKLGSDIEKAAKKKLTELGYFDREQAKKEAEHVKAEELAKTAKTEKDWNEIWLRAKPGSALDKLAKKNKEDLYKARKSSLEEANHSKAEQLAKTAQTEEEWKEIWLNAKLGSDIEKVAKKKLTELGYFDRMQAQKEAENVKAERLAKTAQTEEEWNEVWLRTKPGSALDKRAKERKDNIHEDMRKARDKINHSKAEELFSRLNN